VSARESITGLNEAIPKVRLSAACDVSFPLRGRLRRTSAHGLMPHFAR